MNTRLTSVSACLLATVLGIVTWGATRWHQIRRSTDMLALELTFGPERASGIADLLSQGADPRTCGANGQRTPLILASEMGDHIVVQHLLSRGVGPNESDRCGNVPLCAAAAYGHAMVVDTLLRSGADIESMCAGQLTPLELAAQLGHLEVVERLVGEFDDRPTSVRRALALATGRLRTWRAHGGSLIERARYRSIISLLHERLRRGVRANRRSGGRG